MVNIGQIDNLPRGVVVETLGMVSGDGFTPLAVGPMPKALLPVLLPNADVQERTVAAALAGDLEAALQALIADPVCAKLTPVTIRKMGLELLRANAKLLPQFSLPRR
jgi:alpha-galactosidase